MNQAVNHMAEYFSFRYRMTLLLFPARNLTAHLASVPSNHLTQSARPTLHPFNELRVLAGRTWERQTSA
jgi:hypothetical protein